MPMHSRAQQASVNLEQARDLRAAGYSYRAIGRRLGLTATQLGHIRRTLKREKAGRTRLQRLDPNAGDRDLPVGRSALPVGLRRLLVGAGYRTLGDLADWLGDATRPGFETLAGVGPHRLELIRRLLDALGVLPEPADLKAAVESIFPELGDVPPVTHASLSLAIVSR